MKEEILDFLQPKPSKKSNAGIIDYADRLKV